VLHTKQLTKKRKTYNDGFVVVRASGAVVLLDEGGKELATASAPIPASDDFASSEGITVFDGFLVNGDSECAPCEVPGLGGGGGGAAEGGVALNCAAAPPAAASAQPLHPQPQRCAPLLRQPFKRPAIAGSASGGGGSAGGSLADGAHSSMDRRPVVAVRPPQQQPLKQQQQAGAESQPCGGLRADADILCLLSGGALGAAGPACSGAGGSMQCSSATTTTAAAAAAQGRAAQGFSGLVSVMECHATACMVR